MKYVLIIAILIFIIANTYMLYIYLPEFYEYTKSEYRHDGFIYIINLFGTDILFLIGFLLSFFPPRYLKWIACSVAVIVLHHLVAFTFPVYIVPVWGTTVSTLGLVLGVYWIWRVW